MNFVDVSAEKVTEIVNFIEGHRRDADRQVNIFASSGLRLFVRIRIENPETAALDYHYRVKNLSLGGVLIESVHALEIEKRLPMELTLAEGKSVTFLGRVAFCLDAGDESGEHHDIGIDFSEISEKDKGILREFIASLKKTDEGVSAP
jgi:c-di-GMP-binding flagellar brake protein YcgR